MRQYTELLLAFSFSENVPSKSTVYEQPKNRDFKYEQCYNLQCIGQNNVLQLKWKPKTIELTALFQRDIKPV